MITVSFEIVDSGLRLDLVSIENYAVRIWIGFQKCENLVIMDYVVTALRTTYIRLL